MQTERAEILMNRAIDGTASRDEREQLARAMRADPLLRNDFEEMQTVHASTEALFAQIALPQNFSKRVMLRVQGHDVPSDAGLEAVRLPSKRRSGQLAAAVPASKAHRKRVQIYAIVASVSAAAAMLLALGVFSGFFARSGIGTSGVAPYQPKDVAGGSRGGPDTEELNRTDSSPHQPLVNEGTSEPSPKGGTDSDSAEQPTPPKPTPEEVVEDTPEPDQPEDVVVKKDNPKPDEGEKVEPKLPTPNPEKDNGSAVVDDDTEEQPSTPEIEDEPEGVVDNGERETETAPAPERVLLGRIAGILSGRVEISTDNETWTRVSEDQLVYEGDQVRTQFNGTALLMLDSGCMTLDKRSRVTLAEDNAILLNEGVIALDRSVDHTGDMEISIEDYTLHLSFGCAIVERKRRGVNIQKPAGFASLSHEEFGSVLLDTDSGYEIQADFGKPADEAKKGFIQLPNWSSEARSTLVMMDLDTALSDREFAKRERSYVTSRLPGGVEKLVKYPTLIKGVSSFLNDAIANDNLNGAALIELVGEVEVAYREVSELTQDKINEHAGRAALVAEDYDQWRDYFWRLMRPPVEPKTPKNPTKVPTGNGGSTDCPNADKDKLKRVDKPKKVKTKKVPAKGDNDTPDEDTENKS